MPTRGIVNYMYKMTQLGATPNQIESGLSNAVNAMLIIGITAIIVSGITLFVTKLVRTNN